MKKILFFFGAVGLLVSCDKTPSNQYDITGEVLGLEEGTKVYLKKNVNDTYEIADSTEVRNGKFEFVGSTDELRHAELDFGDLKSALSFILENGKIHIKFDTNSREKLSLSGTKNNDTYAEFNNTLFDKNAALNKFREDANTLFEEASASGNAKVMDSLMGVNRKHEEEYSTYLVDYMKEHKDTYIAGHILNYAAKVGLVEPEEALEIYNAFPTEIKETEHARNAKTFLDEVLKVSIGQIAPDFSAPNPEGKIVSLKESLGKVTIIDFWAAWCGPCRIENPNVVRIYEKFHDQGLNIIGVSLDRDEASWKKAIADDKLTWTQISNLAYWNDPIAKEYSIKGIPATFILDAEGKIVARNLRGEELEKKIEALLSK